MHVKKGISNYGSGSQEMIQLPQLLMELLLLPRKSNYGLKLDICCKFGRFYSILLVSVLCILTSKQVLCTLLVEINSLMLKQLFPLQTEQNKEKRKESGTKTCRNMQ